MTFVTCYDRWLIASIVLLLTLEVYHLWKNLFSPIVVLPTFREESLIIGSSTNIIGIDSVILSALV